MEKKKLTEKDLKNDDLLIRLYYETGDIYYRDIIINNNLKLVRQIAKSYAKSTGLEQGDLESYGYEGLMMAIVNFDFNVNTKFSFFAYHSIKNSILNGMPCIYGFVRGEFYDDFSTCRKILEKETEEILVNNYDLIDQVVELMSEKGLTTFSLEETKNRLHIIFPEALEDLNLDSYVSEEEPFELSIEREEKNWKIREVLENLNPKQLEIVKLLFGFYNNQEFSQVEIGKMYGTTHQAVCNRKDYIIKNLKRTSLKRLYEDKNDERIDSYHTDVLKLGRKL